MFTDPVQFYLTANRKDLSLDGDIKQIVTFLNTVDGVRADLNYKGGGVDISYDISPLHAFLNTNINRDLLAGDLTRQFILTCEREDNVAVNLLRSVISSIGYRIFNPTFKSFMVNELNLIDLTTVTVEPRLVKLFKLNGLKPLFQFRDSRVYFAENLSDNTIHLVNGHMITYFLENYNYDVRKVNDMSVKVAPDISTFIAFFDRGLIPTSFYKTYLSSKKKIVNLEGFDFENLNQDIYFTPVFFKLNKEKQIFKNVKPNMTKDFLKKGTNVIKHITRTVQDLDLAQDFLVAKVAQNIDYEEDAKRKMIPRMSFSIFMN